MQPPGRTPLPGVRRWATPSACSAGSVPVLKGEPINLIDVWDPGAVLAVMLEDRLACGSGATYFLTSLLDHPDRTTTT